MKCREICQRCEIFFVGSSFRWEKESGVVFYPVQFVSGDGVLHGRKETLWWCSDEHCKFVFEHTMVEWSKS